MAWQLSALMRIADSDPLPLGNFIACNFFLHESSFIAFEVGGTSPKISVNL